ncbi:MAG: ABC transporter substrate-binding protein [Candidatus Binatia bacterium]
MIARLTLLALSLSCLFVPSSFAAGGWQEEWEKLTAGAKKEGRLFLAGPRGDTRRQALTETFGKKYGVQVEYLGVGGPELPPRVQRERQGGVYGWDVFIAGTTTLIKGLRPIGALDPIEPILVLPDVKDPKTWRGGELPFFEKERVGLTVLRRAGQYLYVNSNLVKIEEFKSWKELLNPRWKGKILVGRDPRISGYGQSTFAFFYIHKELGPEFIKKLVQQDLKMLEDDRTAAQWIVQGQYPICICSDLQMDRYIKEGLPAKAVLGAQLKEGTSVTSAFANVAKANRGPNPNAARLYVNWVLSKEGGLLFSKATGDPSLRVDVPTDHVEPWAFPQPGWPITNSEEAIKVEEPLVALLKQLLGG